MLYGRQLRDFLPPKQDKYIVPKFENMRPEWKDIAAWCERALAKRGSKVMDRISEHVKNLGDLKIGD